MWCNSSYIALFFMLVLSGCSGNTDPVDKENIHVIAVNEHPFLQDHGRQLKILDGNGETVDTKELQMDTGGGATSFLFEEENQFILIDCNGMWYEINTETGKISEGEWKWEAALPPNYVGTYTYLGAKEYTLTEGEISSLEEVYRFKDPQ